MNIFRNSMQEISCTDSAIKKSEKINVKFTEGMP